MFVVLPIAPRGDRDAFGRKGRQPMTRPLSSKVKRGSSTDPGTVPAACQKPPVISSLSSKPKRR
jgi:hypothetical protein